MPKNDIARTIMNNREGINMGDKYCIECEEICVSLWGVSDICNQCAMEKIRKMKENMMISYHLCDAMADSCKF